MHMTIFMFSTFLIFYFSMVELRANVVKGSGSAFTANVYDISMSAFESYRLAKDNVVTQLTYTVTENYLIPGKPIPPIYHKITKASNFEGSELQFAESTNKTGNIGMFPILAGAISVVYNFPNIQLNLTREHLVDIFLGRINRWNDSRILEHNQILAGLSSEKIKVVVRQDKSGSTEILTRTLSSISEEWSNVYGVFNTPSSLQNNGIEMIRNWPKQLNTILAKSVSGVIGIVNSVEFTIGYVGFTDAMRNSLQIATLKNKHGNFISAGRIQVGVENAMHDFFHKLDHRATATLVDGPGNWSYPLTTYTNHIVNMSTNTGIDCSTVQEYIRFVEWFMTGKHPAKMARSLYFVPLTVTIAKFVQERILRKITCKGFNVYDQIINIRPIQRNDTALYGAIAIGIILFAVSVFVYRGYNAKGNRFQEEWVLKEELLSETPHSSVTSRRRSGVPSEDMSTDFGCIIQYTMGRYENRNVVLSKQVCTTTAPSFKPSTKNACYHLLKSLNQQNILQIYGFITEGGIPHIVSEPVGKGTLHNVLSVANATIDGDIKVALVQQVYAGVSYLHKHGVAHGLLSTSTCLLDSNWTVKISDWLHGKICTSENKLTDITDFMRVKQHLLRRAIETKQDADTVQELARFLIFLDPEVLNEKSLSKTADVYSAAVVVVAVFNITGFTGLAIENFQKKAKLRFAMDKQEEIPKPLRLINKICLGPENERPTAANIIISLTRQQVFKSQSIVDQMIVKMEKHLINLEAMIMERTGELQKVNKRMNELLENMLPKEIALKLKDGKSTPPEYFESASVVFTDIVGFTTICSVSTPHQVISFLNQLYSQFDAICDTMDVYKVETVGDAYMAASGLPTKNGIRHANEVVQLALKMLDIAREFKLTHLSDKQLEIRAGVSSGPVMTGIIGSKKPSYCLFGDTVNVAARMETSSQPLRLLATEATVMLLSKTIGLRCIKRGEIQVKVSGSVYIFGYTVDIQGTLWLLKGIWFAFVKIYLSNPLTVHNNIYQAAEL